MKIICTVNTAKNLDLTWVTSIFSKEASYDELTMKNEYLVMGVAVYKTSPCVHYLIDNDDRPFWYPNDLFIISDPKIPSNWYIQTFDKKTLGGIHFLSGFYELVCNEDFHDDLMERERYAMEIYFKRKIETEKNDLL